MKLLLLHFFTLSNGLTQQTFYSTKLNHIAMQNMLWRLNTPALILVSVSIVKWKKEEFMYLCSDLFFSFAILEQQIGFLVLSVGDILLCVFVKTRGQEKYVLKCAKAKRTTTTTTSNSFYSYSHFVRALDERRQTTL